jgi:hypothetical protein
MTKITAKNAIRLAEQIAKLELNETISFYLTKDGEDANFATMREICDGNVVLIGRYGGGCTVCFDCEYLTDGEAASEIEPLVRQFIAVNCFGEVYLY